MRLRAGFCPVVGLASVSFSKCLQALFVASIGMLLGKTMFQFLPTWLTCTRCLAGRVALKSCHGKYLDTGSNGLPTNNGQDPTQVTWELSEQGQGVYSLSSPDGQYLQAVPPNGDDQQVFLTNECGQSESWQVESLSGATDALDNVEGRFF
jgi:hypothetical protein